MSTTREDRSSKTLINRETTDSVGKQFYNEIGADTINVHSDDIWSETIPDNDPAQAVAVGIAELQTLFVMTEDVSVPNQQSYKAHAIPGDDGSARLLDWISPKYGADFDVRLYDNNDVELFTTDPTNWFFDYQTGILTFSASTGAEAKPFKITGYRYIGIKGVSGGSGSGGIITEENLLFNVDYNDGTAVDPPAGTVFTTQDEIDDFLIVAGTTNFKHAGRVIDSIPTIIKHMVEIDCAPGLHRLETGRSIFDAQVNMKDGSINFHGEQNPQLWTSLHAGGTILGHQTLDEITGVHDPYLDFPGSTFPNDGSLNGKYVVTADDFVSVIWDHTDSRLWLTKKLSPVPTDGVTTAFVAEPSTVFRNSLDDVSAATTNGMFDLKFIGHGASGAPPVGIRVTDITIQDGYANSFTFLATYRSGGAIFVTNVHFNEDFGPGKTSNAVRCHNGGLFMFSNCSILSDPAGANGFQFSFRNTEGRLNNCYVQGTNSTGSSVNGTGSQLIINSSVFRDCVVGILVNDGATLDTWGFGSGTIPTILETPSGASALNLDNTGPNNSSWAFAHNLRFRNNADKCVLVGSNVNLSIPVGDGYIDDGGNGDVGIEFDGTNSKITFPAGTDVTGANGDVRIAGEIETWSDIAADGPFIDLVNGNRIEQV